MVLVVAVVSFLFGRRRGRRRGLAQGRAEVPTCDLCDLTGDVRTLELDGVPVRLCEFCRLDVAVADILASPAS